MINNSFFLIPFTGLKQGKHNYEFEIDKSFFDAIDYSIIHDGSLKGLLELEKKETMLLASFEVEGFITVDCNRCNAPLSIPCSGGYRIIYKFGNEDEEDESIIVIRPDEYQIDVTSPFYELITTQLPLRAVHPEGKCDEEMWELIQKHTLNANEPEENDDDDDDDDESTESIWSIINKN